MSHIKDNWRENDIFHASNLNEIARTINGISDKMPYMVKLARVTQEEYDELVRSGDIDESTLYIIRSQPTSEITATFKNYDGSVLYIQRLVPGAVPEYEGEEPTREDSYDPAGNPDYPYIEYTFSGWNPEIEAITRNTIFTATYSERRYRPIVIDKYVREAANEVSEGKHYILVTYNGYTVEGRLPILINGDTVTGTSSAILLNDAMAESQAETFEELTEFEISQESPVGITTTFKAIPVSLYGTFYLIDENINVYLGAHGSKNIFSIAEVEEGAEPPADGKFQWAINESLEIQNPSFNGGTGKVIQYNPTAEVLRPYSHTQSHSSVLYYHFVSTEKEYLRTRKGGAEKTKIPIVTITGSIEPHLEEGIEDIKDNNSR